MKYISITEWKAREFSGKPWDNRTIKKYIADGKIKGIVSPYCTVIREDQTLDNINPASVELQELIRLSA
jgi:hypothetical protein